MVWRAAHQAKLGCLCHEGLLELRIAGDSERHVHERAARLSHGAVVEAVAAIDGVVHHLQEGRRQYKIDYFG